MKKAVIDLKNEVLSTVLRNQWQSHAMKLHDSIDKYLDEKGDEKSFVG